MHVSQQAIFSSKRAIAWDWIRGGGTYWCGQNLAWLLKSVFCRNFPLVATGQFSTCECTIVPTTFPTVAFIFSIENLNYPICEPQFPMECYLTIRNIGECLFVSILARCFHEPMNTMNSGSVLADLLSPNTIPLKGDNEAIGGLLASRKKKRTGPQGLYYVKRSSVWT